MADQDNYRLLLTDLIKKQMIMLGPNLVISKARKVEGLTVADDGTVTAINGDAQIVLKKLANQFMELSGNIARMTLEALLEKYPGIQNPT